MKLYWHRFSLMPWRVRLALHEKSLAYESVMTDLSARQERTEFLKLNPFGQIPVLVDGDLVMAESMAIVEYLDEKYPDPALMPSDVEARAIARKLMCWSTDYWPLPWKQWIAPYLPENVAGAWTKASVAEGHAGLCQHLDILAPMLEENDWLVGDYSLADICYGPLVLMLQPMGFEAEITQRPSILRWINRFKERQAVKEALTFHEKSS